MFCDCIGVVVVVVVAEVAEEEEEDEEKSSELQQPSRLAFPIFGYIIEWIHFISFHHHFQMTRRVRTL